MRYCGRTFSVQELELIRSLMAEHPGHHRLALSRLVCEHLDWRRPNGGLKDMSWVRLFCDDHTGGKAA